MAVPVLNTYEYQFMDTGVLLNGSTSVPFVDIQKVKGLDIPTIDPHVTDYDSQHGGFIQAAYVTTRTIVLDGIVYANTLTADVFADALTTNFMPRFSDAPFYFKGAGISQRYIMCKPIGFNCDLDNLRSYGASNVQFQLQAGDITKYTDNADLAMVNNNNYVVNNAGNLPTFPKITLTGGFSTASFVNVTTGQTVTIVTNRIAGDVTVVDLKTRSVTINGIRNSGVVTTSGWWSLASGNTTIRVTTTGLVPAVEANVRNGWM